MTQLHLHSHFHHPHSHHHSSNVKDMTVGNPYKLMVGFALPIFFSDLFQQLYNTADALIVGRYLGTEALAAVTSSGTLIFLMISFFAGAAMGGGVVIARYFGANDKENVSKAIHTLIAFGLVSGFILTVAGVALTPTFLKWMQTDPEVLPQAVEYFRFYFLGGMSMVLYNISRNQPKHYECSRQQPQTAVLSDIFISAQRLS